MAQQNERRHTAWSHQQRIGLNDTLSGEKEEEEEEEDKNVYASPLPSHRTAGTYTLHLNPLYGTSSSDVDTGERTISPDTKKSAKEEEEKKNGRFMRRHLPLFLSCLAVILAAAALAVVTTTPESARADEVDDALVRVAAVEVRAVSLIRYWPESSFTPAGVTAGPGGRGWRWEVAHGECGGFPPTVPAASLTVALRLFSSQQSLMNTHPLTRLTLPASLFAVMTLAIRRP
jgi:hypothetical protein